MLGVGRSAQWLTRLVGQPRRQPRRFRATTLSASWAGQLMRIARCANFADPLLVNMLLLHIDAQICCSTCCQRHQVVHAVCQSRSQNNSCTSAPFFFGTLRAPIFEGKRGQKIFRRASRADFQVFFCVFLGKKGQNFPARYARRTFFSSPPEIIKCASCTLVVD